MMDRTEALTAVLNAARALKQAYPLELAQQTITNTWMVGCFAQLYSTVDAVDAVGDATWGEGAVEPAPGMCAERDCWRYREILGRFCYTHSETARAPQVRDVVADGAGNE